jgi:hypothetical protein
MGRTKKCGTVGRGKERRTHIQKDGQRKKGREREEKDNKRPKV